MITEENINVKEYARELKFITSFDSGIFNDRIKKVLSDCADLAERCDNTKCNADFTRVELNKIKANCLKLIKKYSK
jgi:hypothetical protein